MSEAEVRAAFELQADWCVRLDGPFTARLCRHVAQLARRDSVVGAALLDWPGDTVVDVLALRLMGGLHALVRQGALPALAALYPPHPDPADAALAAALTAALDEPQLLPWLASAPQTNEVGRAAVLMAGMCEIAAATGLPLRLFELGASAGLNLRMADYAYDLGSLQRRPPGAALLLQPRWTGAAPPAAAVEVVARHGVDRAPIDLGDAAARGRLRAYVWPEQAGRRARLDAAIAAFVADPVALDTADAADWTEARVAPAPGRATVVYHSISWQYFPKSTQSRIAAHLETAGAAATPTAPLAWLRYEFDGFGDAAQPPTLRLRLWPGGGDRCLARAHPHGVEVEWLG